MKALHKLALMVITMGLAMDINSGHHTHIDDDEPIDNETNKRILQQKQIQVKLKQGLKEFVYGNNIILALNQKSADKKAKKKGYLNEHK